MLDFVLPSDDAQLRELSRSIRRFAQERFDKTEPKFSRDDFSALGELGLCGISLPESCGGSNLDGLSVAAAIFELARAELGPAIYLSVHLMVSALIARCETELSLENKTGKSPREELLNQLATGKKLAAFCLTEAQAGSDASALKTRAEKKESHYIVNGEKIYITSAGEADIYLVFAKTLSDSNTNEISAFLIEKDCPGISFSPAEKKMGCSGSPIASISFQNCKIPNSALLGKAGQGYRLALSGLNGGRVNIAAAACGLASRSIELSTRHSVERKQFNQSLCEFQGIGFMLADMGTKLNASIHLTRYAAQQLKTGKSAAIHASMAKCFATDSAMEITTDAVQIFGGAGYLRDFLVERLMRDAKMLQIVEGTNQVQRILISRAMTEDLHISSK